MINYDILPVSKLKEFPEGTWLNDYLLRKEIEGVEFYFLSLKGKGSLKEKGERNFCDVMLFLKASNVILRINKKDYSISSEYVVRVPYGKGYMLIAGGNSEIWFLRIRKYLSEKDINVIKENPENYTSLYLKSFAECSVYSEDIKSNKSVNRMILPEGLVPRFCMGSVETIGPDEVGEHSHPMLEQVFLGMKNCRCTVWANSNKALLAENMLLHIPLGSKHKVLVKEGDVLSYLWMDFFLSLEGEKYINDQHHMED